MTSETPRPSERWLGEKQQGEVIRSQENTGNRENDMEYPNGSVPYSSDEGRPWLRAKRLACAALNHHPRRHTGSWCFGYGYVCSRCYMYADPIAKETLQEMADAINRLPPDRQQMAAALMGGGGPK